MIDTLAEKVFPLVHAATHEVPFRRMGRRTHVSTLYRWTKTGCRGVKLEYVQCGATRCTSREALSRFFERLTTNSSSEANRPSLTTRRQESERIERRIREIGF